MKKIKIPKEEILLCLDKKMSIYAIAELYKISIGTVRLLLKRFDIKPPSGFYQHIPLSKEEVNKLKSEAMKGDKNPFYGKKHTDITKTKMKTNHADFNGDNNPFKKALKKKPELINDLKNRLVKYWKDISEEEKYSRYSKNIYMDISKYLWTRTKNNARHRNIEFLITPEEAWEIWIQQNGKCALSGIELNLKSSHYISASIDRINSDKSYTKNNIQWVHGDINIIKGRLTNEEFIDMCTMVVINKLYKDSLNDSSSTRKRQNDTTAEMVVE